MKTVQESHPTQLPGRYRSLSRSISAWPVPRIQLHSRRCEPGLVPAGALRCCMILLPDFHVLICPRPGGFCCGGPTLGFQTFLPRPLAPVCHLFLLHHHTSPPYRSPFLPASHHSFLLLLLAQRRLREVKGKSREKTAKVCRKAGGEGTTPLVTTPLVTSMRLAWTKKGCRPTT
ncbi:hypothetical protein N658DRAFT_319704 [Parathielavia hyrcaniae]|uniref:Uncharacterized protein n=1 Tax=Parathielavia hyrcaniae TaxID=113614 RepID=A0AAN6SWY5_9PEZI|nr:hypothetical protein N658DRAFT_319704 [Parathielavia hyrcaniae]